MLYRDIIPSNEYATALTVAELLVNSSYSMQYDIVTKLEFNEDGEPNNRARFKAVQVEANRLYKKKHKEDREFIANYVQHDGSELDVAQYVKTSWQFDKAMLYQFKIIPYILDNFNSHVGVNGHSRKFDIMQNQLHELIRYCKDTGNISYKELEGVTLAEPLSKPEFKKQAKKVLQYIFRMMNTSETNEINKTNATKLVNIILQKRQTIFTEPPIEQELQNFYRLFHTITNVDEDIKSSIETMKYAKKLFEDAEVVEKTH